MSTVPHAAPFGGLRVLFAGLLVAAAAILVTGMGLAIAYESPGWDSRFAYFSAAEAVVEGRSPYPDPGDPILDEDKGYVYPPQLAIALAPLTAFPVDVAASILVVLALLAIVGALAVAGLRDVRCYAAVLLWAPTWNAIENANVSAALALGLALAWRYRDTVWPLATTLGLAISTKLLLWPLLVWAGTTRRLREAALAVVIGAGVTLVSWAAIGFDGLSAYPELMSTLSENQAERSYSLVGMTDALGLDPLVGRVLMLLAGGALLVACVRFARAGDDRRAFACAVAASLVFTPIVWKHYLVLLLVPLAVSRPRFSVVWLLPVLPWVSPGLGHGDGVQPFVPALVAVAVVWAILARPQEGDRLAPVKAT